jgi:hypothetical protein
VSFIDSSVVSISGKVYFAQTSDYTQGKGGCPLSAAEVCAYHPHTKNAIVCMRTPANGEYSISVPMFSEVEVKATYDPTSLQDGSYGTEPSTPHDIVFTPDQKLFKAGVQQSVHIAQVAYTRL